MAAIQEIWSDLHHDLVIDSQGAIKKVINIDAVKTSIDNILRTSKGERVMLREFGSSLKGMLFENIDIALSTIITDEIKTSISLWDDRVIISSVSFKSRPNNNEIEVVIRFVIKGYDEIFNFSTVV